MSEFRKRLAPLTRAEPERPKAAAGVIRRTMNHGASPQINAASVAAHAANTHMRVDAGVD
jgi:hypothetical protein